MDTAILETSGSLSVYFYPDDDVRAGLPILPALFANKTKLPSPGQNYACSFCGNVEHVDAMAPHKCGECGKDEWVIAINSLRVK